MCGGAHPYLGDLGARTRHRADPATRCWIEELGVRGHAVFGGRRRLGRGGRRGAGVGRGTSWLWAGHPPVIGRGQAATGSGRAGRAPGPGRRRRARSGCDGPEGRACGPPSGRPDTPATRRPGVPRPRTASPCPPPPRTPGGGRAAGPATGPALSGRRCDLASLGLAGGPVDPVEGDLPPVHVQASDDAHRDLLRAPPMWLQHDHLCLSRSRSLHIASSGRPSAGAASGGSLSLAWSPLSVVP